MRSRYSVAIIVTVAVLLQLISAVQFMFAHRGIREEVENRAKSELHVKNLEVRSVLTIVETALANTLWTVENRLETPDSLYTDIRRIVEQNPTIVGAGMMFVPNYYPQKGHWFEPYVARRSNGTIEENQIGSAMHNYFDAEFYQNGMSAGKGRWSEPYFDEAGARMVLCTYTMPVHDKRGEIVGLLGADVSLGWLSDVINANHIYPGSFNVVISRTGQVLVGPDNRHILHHTIQEVTASAADTTVQFINRQMLSGLSGHKNIVGIDGRKKSIFYAPLDTEIGWSMAVVCNNSDIYSGLREAAMYIIMLMVAGLALLCYIVYRTAHSARSLREATAEKERIGSELRIARDIQKSMLPMTFPPYPERDDVDIFASLIPAKEVGGDLYDFHLRDEKLFFCIGDVSGKGVPASLVMAVTRSLFRNVLSHEDVPETIVSTMNEALADMNSMDMFVTCFVGVLDLNTGQLRYCNAGHEEPLLIGKGVGLLPTQNNIPVGLMPGWKYEGQDALICPGTTIFLYTDGLTEAEDGNHNQYGKQRMVKTAQQILRNNGSASPETVIALQAEALQCFVGCAEQSDDLTMFAVRYNNNHSFSSSRE
jgi:sigma-B regulation protein RsbU (phosphoserine phosphatase)